MSYQHLTIEARSKIEVLIHEGYTVSRIAKIIGYHRSTVYRELKRCQSANAKSLNSMMLLSLDIEVS